MYVYLFPLFSVLMHSPSWPYDYTWHYLTPLFCAGTGFYGLWSLLDYHPFPPICRNFFVLDCVSKLLQLSWLTCRTNVMDVACDLSTAKKNEISYLTSMLERVSDIENSITFCPSKIYFIAVIYLTSGKRMEVSFPWVGWRGFRSTKSWICLLFLERGPICGLYLIELLQQKSIVLGIYIITSHIFSFLFPPFMVFL